MPFSKKSMRSIKYNVEYNEPILKNYGGYKKNKIGIKELARVNNKTLPNLKKWLKINKNWRRIPNTGVAI